MAGNIIILDQVDLYWNIVLEPRMPFGFFWSISSSILGSQMVGNFLEYEAVQTERVGSSQNDKCIHNMENVVSATLSGRS